MRSTRSFAPNAIPDSLHRRLLELNSQWRFGVRRGEIERCSTMHARDEVLQDLPAVDSVLAVCAHPDDESFGLDAVLSAFAERGVRTSVLCLTHGEASTLGANMGDLHVIREREFSSAAEALGVGGVRLLEFGDGRVAEAPIAELCSEAVVEVLPHQGVIQHTPGAQIS
jgi:LmbE family N-acetylglucosaminyl deacetylase